MIPIEGGAEAALYLVMVGWGSPTYEDNIATAVMGVWSPAGKIAWKSCVKSQRPAEPRRTPKAALPRNCLLPPRESLGGGCPYVHITLVTFPARCKLPNSPFFKPPRRSHSLNHRNCGV